MNFKKKKTRSVLWTWTVSYIIVLFIPFITVFVNYKINIATIKQETLRANELTLNNIADNIDYFLETVLECYQFTQTDERFEKIQMCDVKDAFFYGNVKDHQDILKMYFIYSNVNMEYMFYRDDINYIITNQTSNDALRYYKQVKFYDEYFVEYDEWQDFLKKEYLQEFFVCKNMTTPERGYLLYFANTVYTASFGQPNILIGIPLQEFAELTEYFESEMYLTLNIDNTPVAALSKGQVVGVFEAAKINGSLCIDRTSFNERISYSLILSEDYLSKELRDTQESFIMNVLLTVIFGAVGTIFLVKRNYRPLHELVIEMTGDEAVGNEFQEMSNEYKKLKKENKDSLEIVAKQRKELLGSWLLSMMKGRVTHTQAKEAEAFFEINIDGDLALAGFMIPVCDKRNVQYDELLFFIVDNIFTELMKGYKFYQVEDGRFQLYLFDLKQTSEEEWLQYVTGQMEFLCDMVEEKWGASLTGVVSNSEREFANVRLLYQKVMGAFEYQSIAGNLGVIQTRMIENQDEEERLVEYVKGELGEGLREGNIQKIREITEQMFAIREKIPFLAMKMYVLDICPIASEIYRDYEPDSGKRTDIVRYIELLTESGEMNGLKCNFLAMLEFVCDGVNSMHKKENNSVVGRIIEYVQSHYEDQNLNISSVAEYVQRNPKYISKIFKDETGEGILDYINRLRIAKARELLSTGKYTVEEVMQKTGYVNISSFRRNFMKVTGETPGKYTK